MLFSHLFLGQNGFSLASVWIKASAGCRTALALIPTLARENPLWPRKKCENAPYLHMYLKYIGKVKYIYSTLKGGIVSDQLEITLSVHSERTR